MCNNSNLQCTLLGRYPNFGLFFTVFGPFFDISHYFLKLKTFVYIVENIYWPRLIILKRFCSITVSYSINFYANIAVFDHFWTVFLIFFWFLTAKNTCVHSREHSLTVTKHWQCFWAIIVTYGVHFHVNFTILGCFWPFLGRFLLFFFSKLRLLVYILENTYWQ